MNKLITIADLAVSIAMPALLILIVHNTIGFSQLFAQLATVLASFY